MKGNITKVTKKGKPRSKKETLMSQIKTVRTIDRELAIENNTFHNWIPKTKVHTDRKKKANKNECREFKKNKNS